MSLTLDRPPIPTIVTPPAALSAPPRKRVTTPPAGDAATRPFRAAVVLVVFVGLVAAGVVWHAPRAIVVRVNGRSTTVEWRGATVAHAVHAAGIRPHDGVLYAAKSGRVLDVRADPVRIERNGRAAGLDAPVARDDVIVVVDGRDRVEEIDERRIPLAPPGLPDVETSLWRDEPGWVFERKGRHSGEVLERRVLAEPVRATPDHRRVVALTFDDGPDPRWTPAVLDVLAAEEVTATFCVVGSLVRSHPGLVRAIADAGHTLCNHTDNHVVHLGDRPPAEIARQIRAANDAIIAATGRAPAFYRAPGGTLSPGVIDEARRQGLRVLGWSVDPYDWRRPGSGVILERVVADVGPGGVVLLHDGGGDRSQTVSQLREMIQRLRDRGFSFEVPGPGATPA